MRCIKWRKSKYDIIFVQIGYDFPFVRKELYMTMALTN